MGLSYNFSSNSLRNSPKFHSFPKSERFPPLKPSASFVSLSPLLSPKKISMGSGNRGQFIQNLPGMDTPSPADYDFMGYFGKQGHGRGKSFGVGYNENLYYPESHLVTSKNAAEVPGPGQYDTGAAGSIIGKGGKKATLKGKLPSSFLVTHDVPSPHAYSPKHALVESTKGQGTSFGVGDRPDLFYGKAVGNLRL